MVTLLNIPGINAFTVHQSNTAEGEMITQRRLFSLNLGLRLMKNNLQIRANDLHINENVTQLDGTYWEKLLHPYLQGKKVDGDIAFNTIIDKPDIFAKMSLIVVLEERTTNL